MTVLRIAALIAIGFALLVSIWRPGDAGGLFAGLEGRTLDARFALRGELKPPDNIAILAIDDATLSALKAFPPPRDALAGALNIARGKGATVIAFDLLLKGDGKGDDELVKALGEKNDAVLAISLSGEPSGEVNSTLQAAVARSALSLVIGAPKARTTSRLGPSANFAARAGLAHVNVTREADGALRRILLANEAGGGLTLPALPVEAVRRHLGLDRPEVTLIWGEELRMQERAVSLNRFNEAGVSFYGPRSTIPTYPLIEARTAPLKNRMVFIGATAKGFGDTFSTPFDRDLPGVEILATMAANILEDRTLQRDKSTWGLDILLAAFASFAAVWAASRARPVRVIALTLLVWLLALAALQYAFLSGLWLDGATLLMSLLVATLAGGGARWLLHRKNVKNLAQYQSPLLQNVLADQSHPLFDGRIQKAAALFVDAADFTSRTTRLGTVGTTQFLRAFHRCVERAAADSGGVVEHYAGDGAMICFGLPEPKPQDALNALNCTDRLFEEIEAFSRSEIKAGQQKVSIRIGAHYGDVSAAVLGGKSHSHVTFVGDVINSASRLQEAAKELNAELVVSNILIDACGPLTRSDLTRFGSKMLRGRQDPLEIWVRYKRQ